MCGVCDWIRKLRDPVVLTNVTMEYEEEDEEAVYREPLLADEDA